MTINFLTVIQGKKMNSLIFSKGSVSGSIEIIPKKDDVNLWFGPDLEEKHLFENHVTFTLLCSLLHCFRYGPGIKPLDIYNHFEEIHFNSYSLNM